MPNPLEFFKGLFSAAGKVVAKTGEVAAEAGDAILKGGISVDVPSSGISLPDFGDVAATVASGAKALGGVAGASLKNYNAPNKIDSSGLEEAAQSSVDLRQKILKNRISETKIKHTNKQPINMLSSIDTPKIKVKETAGEDFTAKKTQEDLTPAKILYGPREKTQKEIQKEKSYPKYIEDFSQAQLLYADKGIIKKAEQASKNRNGNRQAWLEPNDAASYKPLKGRVSSNIQVNDNIPKAGEINSGGNGKEISSEGKYVERNPKLNNEVRALLSKFHGANLNDKSLIDKIFNDMSNDLRELVKKKFDEIIRDKTSEELADMIGTKYKIWHDKLAQLTLGKDAAGMLDISHPIPNNPDYIKDAFKFESYKDAKLTNFQGYLKDKLKSQFKGYDIDKIQGYYFPPNSEPSLRILQDSYFKEFLKANRQNIFNGEKKLTVNFKSGNMYYAHHLADVLVQDITPEGNLRVIIADTNDYNVGDPSKLVQAGLIAMKKGDLIPLFVLKEVEIPKAELDKIWK